MKKSSYNRKLRKLIRKTVIEEVKIEKSETINHERDFTAFGTANRIQDNRSNPNTLNNFGSESSLSEAVHSEKSDYTHKEDSTHHKIYDNLNENKPTISEIKNEYNSPFPDLIMYYEPFMHMKGVQLVNRCLSQFSNYGRLVVECERNGFYHIVRILYNGIILAESQASVKSDAELAAGAKLLQLLRSTNYTIEAKERYFRKKKLPDHVSNVDPSKSHIYKVVCLRKPGWTFPFQLVGAVDYISSDDALWEYIEHHIDSSEADLYVLNLNPDIGQLKIVLDICKKKNICGKKMIGVSNRGVYISRNKTIKKIFEELKECGGENLKYRLIPPGGKSGYSNHLVNEEELDECTSEVDTMFESQEVIETPQYIANNLILMDFIKNDNTLQTPREIVRLSVMNCPNFEEYLVEKKFDKTTCCFTAEALIDRKVVGRAKDSKPNLAKLKAADNALENLKRSCVYIKAKMSYFENVPPFPWDKQDSSNKIYRIVHPSEATNEMEFGKLLLSFVHSKLQDLFFLQDFSHSDKQLVKGMARDMKLLVREFRDCLCVWKNVRPKELYKNLSKNWGENEKYKLITPSGLSSKSLDKVDQCVSNESQIKSLFDFGNQTTDSPQQINQDLNKNTTIHTPYKREKLSSERFEHSVDVNYQNSRDSYRQNHERWHSEMNKRSYAEGPGCSEADNDGDYGRAYGPSSFRRDESQALNYHARGMQDGSLFQRRTDLATEAKNYHSDNSYHRMQKYGQKYQHEQQCTEDKYSTKQGRWSKDVKRFYDQRF